MSPFLTIIVVIWGILMVAYVAVGGYFMIRKFLKSMPKADGKSDLDWQEHYIDLTRSFWTDETLELLNDMLKPVPEMFREVARRSIAAKIGKFALDEGANKMTRDLVIKGYILATPPRDHKMLLSYLKKKQIDYTPYIDHFKIKVKV